MTGKRIPGLQGADSLATRAASNQREGESAECPPEDEQTSAHLTGVKLANATQRGVHAYLKTLVKVKKRKATAGNLDRIRYALADVNGRAPSQADIWRSTRGMNTSRKTQTFRWKNIHEAHATGEYFERMENMAHLAMCPRCEVTESMEHIQLDCQIEAAETVWEAAQKIWECTGERWPTMTYGLILGCGNGEASTVKEQRRK
ncbi:hypothetical protein BDZ89DRAFT_1011709 [Hymenopellis radicata]|nr:hypothetical protein BDZ89DRAFT_1011709 [Hymenopellis radicata]